MKLERHDKDNPLWVKLKKMLEERLDTLRKQNDGPALTHDQTQVLRGQIQELKTILDMDKEKPVMK